MANGNGGVSALKEQLTRAKGMVQRMKEKGDAVMDVAFAAAEVSAVAGIIGAVEGYHGGDVHVFGEIPAELAVAGGLHAYGLMSGTKHAEHVHNLANGALAVASYKAGKRLGEKAKKNKTEKGSIFGADENGRAAELPAGARVYGGGTAIQPRTVIDVPAG